MSVPGDSTDSALSSSLDDSPSPIVPAAVRKRGFLTPAFWGFLAVGGFLLYAVLGPSFIRSRASGRVTACKGNLKKIGAALDRFASEHRGDYPGSLDVLIPKYLEALPVCAAAGKASYRGYFGLRSPYNNAGYPDYYWVECHGGNHEDMGVKGDFPAIGNHSGVVSVSPYETRR